MAEFEEKLNHILSNPDAMSQIMQLAQSLSGDAIPPPQTPPAPPPKEPSQDPISSFLEGADPGFILKLLPFIQELGSQKNSNARQLLYALRPYLKEDRQDKVERALQLARVFYIGKKFLANWEGL